MISKRLFDYKFFMNKLIIQNYLSLFNLYKRRMNNILLVSIYFKFLYKANYNSRIMIVYYSYLKNSTVNFNNIYNFISKGVAEEKVIA